MRINEFSIRRYGPLPDTGRVTLGDFSLLFGKNEYGKTLTIDALVKLLLQHGRSLFEQIKRVDEEPEGYVVVDDPTGKEMKLPEKGDLTYLTGLTPEECRNIFIIRNSDLSIAIETEFYRNVTDRLTGLRTEKILSIKNQLQEIGKLTRPDSAGSLRDRSGEKLKTRAKQADNLIRRIDELQEEVAEEGLDNLEEMLFKVKEQTSETSHKIETFEEARKRKEYEEGSKAYQTFISAQQELEKLSVYTNEDVDIWANCERDTGEWTKESNKLQKEVNLKRIGCEQKVRELDEKKLVFESLSNRKTVIDDQIRPQVKNYEIKSGELKPKEVKQGFFSVAAIISTLLLVISIVGVIANPSSLLYVLLTVSLIATLAFATLRFLVTREKAWLSGMFERIRLAASRFELHAETVEEILSDIQKFDEEYSRKQKELEQSRTSVSLLESEIKRITDIDIVGLASKIAQARNKIDVIAQKTGLQKLQEYHGKLKLKMNCQQSAEMQLEILRSHFGHMEGGLDENLPYWHGQIEALKGFENKAMDITYDEKSVSQLKGELVGFQGKEQELTGKIVTFCDELREVQREANEVLQLEDDYLRCDSSVDMIAIRDKLLKFLAEVEENKDNALIVISIFEGLEKEEEEKISSLFGKDSPVSQYFSEITGGIYKDIEFIIDDVKKIQVRLKDGGMLDAIKLSGGAYDQLYLSIRLALGQKLLKGVTGFFIMDDPFIKADKERLQRQIDVLRRVVSELGWQIVYFTAKDEVVNVLKSDIQKGKVHYIELQGVFA